MLAALAIIAGLATTTSNTLANDINMHPAGCQAPFLDQAFPMRWHEMYLMNPASNRTTWVICPTTWDEDVVNWPAGASSFVEVHGAIESGASPNAPLCFFAAADRDNLQLPPYISIPGGKKSFIQNLGTTKTPPRWNAQASVSHDSILSALGNTGPFRWAVSVFCELPPGHAITNIFITQ
jgi:hypothetical protein